MESKEGLKMEDVLGNSSYSQYMVNNFSLQSIFDLSSREDEKISSLGFMDLISAPLMEMTEAPESEPINQPATSNYSSISSASTEACNDEPVKVDEQDENQQKTKKQLKLKPKKTNQKRQRDPRFAFMTKSSVDHLEDGYRWRKYGQKAVKNSSFPRSYYRCTTASCNVKKRVERSYSDPSIVVTTYEGQHTHPSPTMPRPNLGSSPLSSAMFAAAYGMPMQWTQANYHRHHQQPFTDNLAPGPSLLKDHGLLQDILPSHMLKEQ